MHDFQDLLILLAMIWTAGAIFKRLNLPQVFGEILAGIVIGPAVLNMVDPHSEMLLTLSELGIFFLMLHTGLKSDHKELFSKSGRSFLIGIGGMALSFLGGYFVSRQFDLPLNAALFMGVGLSVSAVPLAARMFKEYGVQSSDASHYTMGATLINDIVALIVFSAILNFAETGEIDAIALLVLSAKTLTFLAAMILGGVALSPWLDKIIYKGNKGFTFTLIMSLLIGVAGEYIGLHLIIGAFFAGLFIRQEVIDEKTFDKIEDRIYGLSYSFFGPIFFATLAFHLDFGSIKEVPVLLISLIAVAILGKVIGSGLVAYVSGINFRESAVIASAMNNRGAVELVMASVGIQAGIINEKVFSILVLTALATTLVSILTMGPLVRAMTEKPATS